MTIIDDILAAVRTLSSNLDLVVTAPINTNINKTQSLLEVINDKIGDPIGSVIEDIKSIVENITTRVRSKVESLIGPIFDVGRNVIEKIVGTSSIILNTVDDFIGALTIKVKGFVEEGFANVETFVDATVSKAGDIASLAIEGVANVIEGLGTAAGEALGSLGDKFSGAIGGLFPNFLEFLAPDSIDRLTSIIEEFEETPDLPDEIKKLTSPGIPPLIGAGAAVGIFFLIPAINQAASATLGPWMNLVTQNVQKKARSNLLAPGDYILGERRQFIQSDVLSEKLARSGISNDDIGLIRSLATQPLNVQENIALWLRDEIPEAEFTNRLNKLGFLNPEIEGIKVLSQPIPSISDITSMAVKEVFTPEIASRFGQFEEIPDDYLLWSKRQGLSDFWARNIWAAHWSLPSVNQGFTMLHRGVINREDLDRLFVALDIMPFWRDPISRISFNPLTRVDIRRMHRVGVLSDSDVLRSYFDLGYNEINAERLTAFTLTLTENAIARQVPDEKDLTKGELLGLLQDGLVSEVDTIDALQIMGFDETESGLLVERIQLKLAANETKRTIKVVLDQFRVGSLSFETAQDRFGQLELGDLIQAKAVTDLERLRLQADTLPSKGDLRRWFKADIMSEEAFREGLELLGFAEHWIRLFIVEKNVAALEGDDD